MRLNRFADVVIFWYRGLAQGGIAAVGQLQLLQPFFGLALAGTLLHEHVSPIMLIVTVAIVGCVAGAKQFANPRRQAFQRRTSASRCPNIIPIGQVGVPDEGCCK
jgi:hypothetical protein